MPNIQNIPEQKTLEVSQSICDLKFQHRGMVTKQLTLTYDGHISRCTRRARMKPHVVVM